MEVGWSLQDLTVVIVYQTGKREFLSASGAVAVLLSGLSVAIVS